MRSMTRFVCSNQPSDFPSIICEEGEAPIIPTPGSSFKDEGKKYEVTDVQYEYNVTNTDKRFGTCPPEYSATITVFVRPIPDLIPKH